MKKEVDNIFTKLWKSIKRLFIYLFGFGKSKEQAVDLKEEEIVSPSKQIFRKFIRNKIAIFGLVLFIAIVLFVFIGGLTFDFNPAYTEGSQQEVEPNRSFLKVPNKLKKSGVKKIVDKDGNEQYLMGVGSVYSMAISNDNKFYVWGGNINDVKEIPQRVKDNAKDIIQLSVGQQHTVALFADGTFEAWGRNSHQQSQIPRYIPRIISGKKEEDITIEDLEENEKVIITIEAYFTKEIRKRFPELVKTTIEEDPIRYIYAGADYTTVLTENGYVYTWGVAFTKYIGSAQYSYNYYKHVVEYRMVNNEENKPVATLQWKYAGDLSWTKIATIDELISENNIQTKEGFKVVFRINEGNLQWGYAEIVAEKKSEKDPEAWTTVKTVAAIIEELPESPRIIQVYPMENHVAYIFEDNSVAVRGLSGAVLNLSKDLEKVLSQSEAERGYKIVEVVGTRENAFYLTDKGDVVPWGATYTTVYKEIPSELRNVKIVDIESGSHHVVALDENGVVYTWGENELNQISMPKKMKKSNAATKVVSGYFVNYGISEDGKINAWGNKGYFFGTNAQGADNMQRIIIGGRMTLSIALIAVVVSLVLGLIAGLVAGFYGGWVDNLIMRFGEIINAFPFLPLAMTLAKLVEEWDLGDKTRIVLIMVILGFLSWPGLARLVRGQILAEREKDFVIAAKSLGIKDKHIITRHILPNVINVVIVNTTLSYAGALLTESGLSFLNFGVKYPNPSWGNMLVKAQDMVTYKLYWWLWVIPGMFIVLTALSINLVGDGLRDAMDPKSNER